MAVEILEAMEESVVAKKSSEIIRNNLIGVKSTDPGFAAQNPDPTATASMQPLSVEQEPFASVCQLLISHGMRVGEIKTDDTRVWMPTWTLKAWTIFNILLREYLISLTSSLIWQMVRSLRCDTGREGRSMSGRCGAVVLEIQLATQWELLRRSCLYTYLPHGIYLTFHTRRIDT